MTILWRASVFSPAAATAPNRAAKLRPGNMHSADGWVPRPVPGRRGISQLQRHGAFDKPEIYEALEERGVKSSIRIPANAQWGDLTTRQQEGGRRVVDQGGQTGREDDAVVLIKGATRTFPDAAILIPTTIATVAPRPLALLPRPRNRTTQPPLGEDWGDSRLARQTTNPPRSISRSHPPCPRLPEHVDTT